jgi:hypothetical protein
MCLEQGEKSVQDYYGELQKGKMRCGIVEGPEDSICRFYSGLRREIQDIVDYKEFNSTDQLFQFAMLAEKELQGREQQGKGKSNTTYTPRATPSMGLNRPSTFRVPPPESKRPTASGVAAPAHSSGSGKILRRCPPRVPHPWHQRVAPPAFSAIVATGLGMCRRTAQARGHTLRQRMATSAPPTLKMKKRKKMMEKKRSLVERIQRSIGVPLFSGCSTHKCNNPNSYNATIYFRFSSSSKTDVCESSLMEVAATIW